MSNEIDKEIKEAFVALVMCPLNVSGNRTEYKISKIISLINEDKFFSFFENEFNRMTKYKFEEYYGSEVLALIKIIKTTLENLYESVGTKELLNIKDILLNWAESAWRSTFDFEWENYDTLKKANYLDIIKEFDTDFRGRIQRIETVNNKYVVIDAIDEAGESKYYSYRLVDKKVKKTNSNVYPTYEESLIGVMLPRETFYDAMVTLYKQAQSCGV